MSSTKLYFQNQVAMIEEHGLGYASFTYKSGVRSVPHLQAAMTQLTTLLEARRWFRVLNKQQYLQPFSPREMALITAFWQERTHRWGHGLCVASVLAQQVFARIAATTLRQKLSSAGLLYSYFDTEQQAAAWLSEQQEPPPLLSS